ncbi:hypothetical protein ScPMuIL_008744 [Solemya velum]
MEDGRISAEQIVSSSVLGKHEAHQARINTADTGWVAGDFDEYQYIQVDFNSTKEVTSMAVQGANGGWFSQKIRLYYSADGLLWNNYNSLGASTLLGEELTLLGEELTASANYRDIVNIIFDSLIKARYIAVNPSVWSGYPALRLEFYGCNSTETSVPHQTTVNANIESTEVWLPSQSPYLIDQMIHIRPTANVLVQPGVQILFLNSEAGITVHGVLNITGISSFKTSLSSSSHPFSTESLWKSIVVKPGGELEIDHAVIRGGAACLNGSSSSKFIVKNSIVYQCRTGIVLTKGDIQHKAISDTIIAYNYDGIDIKITEHKQHVQISGCKLNDNSNYGLRVDGNRRYNTHLEIRNTKILRNKNYGLYLVMSGQVSISNATLDDNKDGMYLMSQYDPTNFLMDLSSVQGNGYGINTNTLAASVVNITNTVFQNSRDSIHFSCRSRFSMEKWQMSLLNNTFQDNFGYSSSAIQVSPCTYFDVVIENNTFQDGTRAISWNGRSESVLENVIVRGNRFHKFTGTYEAIKIVNSNLMFSYNKILNCSIKTFLSLQNGLSHQIHHNQFIDSDDSLSVLVGNEFHTVEYINASHNFWGSTDKVFLHSHICDFFCDMKKGRVEIMPVFTTVGMDEILEIPKWNIFSVRDQVSGGVLESSVNVEDLNSYIISRSILVPENLTLTLGRNTSLSFKANRGIYVQGSLVVSGATDQNQAVHFLGHTSDGWNGIYINNGDISLDGGFINGAVTGIHFSIDELSSFNYTIQSTVISNCDKAVGAGSSTVIRVTEHSVKSADRHIKLVAVNCQISMSGNAKGFEVSLYYSSAEVSVFGCSFFDNRIPRRDYDYGGVVIQGGSQQSPSSSISLSHNTFQSLDGTACHFSGYFSGLDIVNNFFNSGSGAISVTPAGMAAITIRNNTFTNCTSNNLINLDYGEEMIRFEENRLFNNSGTMLTLKLVNVLVKYNFFDNPQATCNIKFDSTDFVGQTVNATLNYWGLGDFKSISRTIYDAAFNTQYADVVISLFLGSMNYSDIQTAVDSFLDTNGNIGGKVEGNVTLSIEGSPYLVINNIIVESEDVLIIEPGVILMFLQGINMQVEGLLQVMGNSSHPVQMVPHTRGERWEGVEFIGTKLNNVAMDLKHLSVRKQKYVPKLKDCMYKRFDDILEKEDSFEVLKCLYTGLWPMESDDLKEYGLNEIEKLIFHFRVE